MEHFPLDSAGFPIVLGNGDDGTVVLEDLEFGGTSLTVFRHVPLFVAEFCQLMNSARQGFRVDLASVGFDCLGLPAAEGFFNPFPS